MYSEDKKEGCLASSLKKYHEQGFSGQYLFPRTFSAVPTLCSFGHSRGHYLPALLESVAGPPLSRKLSAPVTKQHILPSLAREGSYSPDELLLPRGKVMG